MDKSSRQQWVTCRGLHAARVGSACAGYAPGQLTTGWSCESGCQLGNGM